MSCDKLLNDVLCSTLTEALREAQSQNKDLSRQVQELTTVRVQLQNERDALSAELSETKDALKDALARLDAANAALTQLRTDMEHRLREKDDEIENIRLVGLIASSIFLSSKTPDFSSDRVTEKSKDTRQIVSRNYTMDLPTQLKKKCSL